MGNGAQVDLDWSGADSAQGDAASHQAGGGRNGASAAAHLTDEEILGIDAHLPDGAGAENDAVARVFGGGEVSRDGDGDGASAGGASSAGAKGPGSEDPGYSRAVADGMPSWMAAAAADPAHAGEAAALWREHQEFRAAFASPEEARAVKDEARAIKELLPGGVRDIVSLREATQSVERIDAALFSGEARAQAEVVAEIARANPAAFRALFAEAAKFLAGGGGTEAGGREARNFDGADANGPSSGPTLRTNREGWGTPKADAGGSRLEDGIPAASGVPLAGTARAESSVSPATSHQSPVIAQGTNHPSRELRASEAPFAGAQGKQATNHGFDPAAYAVFERATNDAVARDVRGSIGDTLARVMPEGVAEGATRRIGEDIFNEVHRALAADPALSEQVAAILRDPSGASATGAARANGANAGAWRFGSAEQQRVAALLAGRAKQLVPSVARRVIGEWTGSVLNTARAKSARQAAAAARVDIAAPGGSLDSMPLRQMSPKEVNYARMSDEEILGM